jgi:flagellar hook-associated protein 1
MSLSQALNTSLSGLRTTQLGMSLVASNIANAQTPGYVRKSLIQNTTGAGEGGGGVRVAAINRELDIYLQRQMRVELSGGSYATLRSDFYQRLQQIYGEPGSDSALETVFNNFANSIQTLLTSPESTSARNIVLSSAQVLAEQLNAMTDDIQALRGDTEAALADAVTTANNAMAKIAAINSQLVNTTAANATEATMLDQRDFYVDQLAELMDIRVVVGEHNQLNVFTNSGMQLVGTAAAQLDFDPAGTVTPATLWNSDPAISGLGTLRLRSQGGAEIDLIATKAIRSGKIAALVEMRDDILVEAQTQLDSIAATLASALSDETVDGSAVSSGPQDGFELDTAGLLAGNRLSLTYTDQQTNQQHHVTIIRVDDPDALPLTDAATADPNDEVIGIDFSAGLPAAVAELNSRFGGRLQFSNVGSTLRVLDDGLANRFDIDAFSITQTASSVTGTSAALPSSPTALRPSATRSGPATRKAAALPAASRSIRR